MGVDIDNTDNPIEAGLGFAVAWDKPGGFIGRDACSRRGQQGPPRHRVVSLIVDDPAADLFGNEPVLADGEWVSYVRAAAYGYTVGGRSGWPRSPATTASPASGSRGRLPRAHPGRGDRRARLQIAPPLRPAAAAHPRPVTVTILVARRATSGGR